MAYDGNKHTFS